MKLSGPWLWDRALNLQVSSTLQWGMGQVLLFMVSVADAGIGGPGGALAPPWSHQVFSDHTSHKP